MIRLTKLNGKEFYLNAELIEMIETTPDTIISLITDKKIIVLEDIDTIIDKILEFKKKLEKFPEEKIFESEV